MRRDREVGWEGLAQLLLTIEAVGSHGNSAHLVLLIESDEPGELLCPLVPGDRLRIHQVFAPDDFRVPLGVRDHESLRDVAVKRCPGRTTAAPATTLPHLRSGLHGTHGDAVLCCIDLRNVDLDLLVGLEGCRGNITQHGVWHEGIHSPQADVHEDTILPNTANDATYHGADLEFVNAGRCFRITGACLLPNCDLVPRDIHSCHLQILEHLTLCILTRVTGEKGCRSQSVHGRTNVDEETELHDLRDLARNLLTHFVLSSNRACRDAQALTLSVHLRHAQAFQLISGLVVGKRLLQLRDGVESVPLGTDVDKDAEGDGLRDGA
mmetsp:Transcript_48173/g.112732  ORF Transcript_48173/g.112732 Transcript_48173/m.112732 type:complete len:323 (+) Transcript_48173:341-1309(+)